MSSNGNAVKSSGWLINLVSFVAVICIGVSLILTKVGLSGKVTSVLSAVAQIIAYGILCIVSFFYIRNRRSITLWVIWGISVVLIVISFIL